MNKKELLEAVSKTVTTRELIDLISKSSEYHKYEVEDILDHCALHLGKILRNGKAVKIEGIGTISRRDSKQRKFTSPITGLDYTIDTNVSATLKPDIYLKNALNLPEEDYNKLSNITNRN